MIPGYQAEHNEKPLEAERRTCKLSSIVCRQVLDSLGEGSPLPLNQQETKGSTMRLLLIYYFCRGLFSKSSQSVQGWKLFGKVPAKEAQENGVDHPSSLERGNSFGKTIKVTFVDM